MASLKDVEHRMEQAEHLIKDTAEDISQDDRRHIHKRNAIDIALICCVVLIAVVIMCTR